MLHLVKMSGKDEAPLQVGCGLWAVGWAPLV